MFCRKCGAEIPEGAGFCEKCGNPVGKTLKQENNKKRWVIAISSGVIVLAAAIAGVLYVTGILGGKKDEAVQVDADHVTSTETNYNEQNQFSLIYLDEDDSPELIIIDHGSRVGETYIYTYQNGEVSETFIDCAIDLYQEKQGYI